MTLLELSAYFQEISSRHVLLKPVDNKKINQSFFCLNTDKTADEFIRASKLETIFVLMPPDKKMLPATAQNYNWDKHVAFMVLHRCADATAEKTFTAQNLCELIADDFVAQMLADLDSLLAGLEASSIVMEPVGPVADCHYGYICLFTLVDNFNHYLNADRLPPR